MAKINSFCPHTAVAGQKNHRFNQKRPFSPEAPVPAAQHRRLAPFGAEPAVGQPEPVWTNTEVK
jgi:hypothetical protein